VQRWRSDDPLARLPPREQEVLALLATGSSDQGIDNALVISERLVQAHVSHIFAKLGLPASRHPGIPASRSVSHRVITVLQYLRS
jgi:DNA-binding NarL/FixJ family response regulator